MRGSTLIDPRRLTVPPGSASREVQEAEARWRAPRQLEADLRRVVRGEVRFDRGSRALYSTDASNFRAVPIGVVVPEHEEDVMAAGTCVTVLEAVLHLIPQPPARVLVVLGYEDVYAAADAVPDVRRYRPIGLEGMDDRLADDLRRNNLHEDSLSLLPDGRGWLLVEFGGEDRADARAQAEHLVSEITRGASGLHAAVYEEPDQQERLWLVRESGLGATANVTGERPTWEGWEDSAVPPERFGAYLRELRTLLDRYGYRGDFYGHFGQGCLHTRIDFGLTSAAGIRKYRGFLEEAADLVVRYGGSLSGEHGDGQTRGELLARMYPAEVMEAFRAFKRAWDPDGGMNPGKLIDARPLDRDLRLGADYSPPQHHTHFDLPEDSGSLAKAALRCVGVGKCRRTDTGTMCPSYMVTREEKHTTRGRAHLLVEMMQGDPLEQGWQSEAVHEALDLCLLARAARASVRCRWTWPPTRLSSSRTTTSTMHGRAPPTPSDTSGPGRGWSRASVWRAWSTRARRRPGCAPWQS
jgi:hypothetical protein